MYYIIILILLGINFLYDFFIKILELKSLNRPIPENVSDIYDLTDYNKWKKYSYEKTIVAIIQLSVYSLVIILMFVFKVFQYFEFTDNSYTNIVTVLSIYIGISTVINVIFNYINTFKVEAKYGFNRTKMKTFIADEVKGLIIEYVITVGLTMLYASLFELMHEYVIISFTALLILIVFIINLFAPKTIKLFNKMTPLEAGELRDKLEDLLKKNGYKVKDICVIDSSKRSTKANAAFVGMGKLKTIVLYDTIISSSTPDELVAIFAHELGHGKHHDTSKGFIRSILLVAIMIVAVYFLSTNETIYNEFAFKGINIGFSFIILAEVLISFISPLLSLFSNVFSRKQEYAADSFATDAGYGNELISGLKKLTKANYGDLNPHPLLVNLYYSHPTLSQRIDNIKKNPNFIEKTVQNVNNFVEPEE